MTIHAKPSVRTASWPAPLTVGLLRESALTAMFGYDPADHEAEVDVLVRSRREHEKVPARSRWEYGWILNGEIKREFSPNQRHWTAAMLRHAADSIEADEIVAEAPPLERAVHQAKRLRVSAQLALGQMLDVIGLLIEHKGLEYAAARMEIRPNQLRRMVNDCGGSILAIKPSKATAKRVG